MKNFFKDIFYTLKTWVRGRYGTDALSWTLIIVALLVSFVSGYLGEKLGSVVSAMGFAVMVFAIFRIYSSNVEKRRAELAAFKRIFSGPISTIKMAKLKKQDPAHLYIKCPKCKTILRVPKGNGRIIITCPNCQNKVEVKS